MKEETLKIDYELVAQDYIDFNLFHLRYSKKIKKLFFIQRFIMPLIYFALPFVLARASNVPVWAWMIISVAIYLLWVFIYPRRMEKNLTKKLLKALKQEKNSKLLGKHSIKLGSDGIIDDGKGGETKVKWNAITDIGEDKEHLFIFISESKAFIVPRRAFESEDMAKAFITRIKDKINAY